MAAQYQVDRSRPAAIRNPSRKRSLPETSIETTSRWPRNRHESSWPTTVLADFVSAWAMGRSIGM